MIKIQVVTDTGKVRLIDLEYSGPNYAAFDIANLFNEYDDDNDDDNEGDNDDDEEENGNDCYYCRWVGFDLDNMDFVGNYPSEQKVNSISP